MSERQYEHGFPAWSTGFVQIPNEILLNPSISAGAIRTWALFFNLASRNGEVVDPPLAEAAGMIGVSENALRKYVRELVDLGLLTTRRRGQGMPNVYTVLPPQNQGVLNRTKSGSGNAEAAVPSSSSRSSLLDEDHPSGDPHAPTSESEINVPVIRRSDGKVIQLAPRPGKVDRKPVTDEEYLLADEVLSKFNELAGTRFRSADWISKIIMRLREHPGSTIEQHEQVIRGNLADPWWRGPASPSVIYGSGAQFERSIATVEQPANPDKPMSEEELAAWVRGDA